MPPQLVQRTLDHAHGERLPGGLALSEHFERDQLDRVSSTHALSVRTTMRLAIALAACDPAAWPLADEGVLDAAEHFCHDAVALRSAAVVTDGPLGGLRSVAIAAA
jgi:hypothetical protein